MPKFPTDMAAARQLTERKRQDREATAAKKAAAIEHDKAVIREFANELRAKEGLPPLEPDEPVMGFFCRRGRR